MIMYVSGLRHAARRLQNVPSYLDVLLLLVGSVFNNSTLLTAMFLALDEAVVSRTVFIIVPGSDGRAQTFRSQLNNSKTVRDRRYMSIES